MIYLHKLLPLFVSPLFLIIILLLTALVTKQRKFIVFAIFVTYTLSTPYFARFTTAHLEKDYLPRAVTELPKADHVIVLGGITRTIKQIDGTLRHEFNESVDRIHAAIEILRTGRANKMHLTRAYLPWSLGRSEGEFLKDFAVKQGINPNNIRLTLPAQNTAQEAQHFKGIFRSDETVILVTSAFHMPRALDLFRSHGIEPIPYAVDHRVYIRKPTPMDFMPNASALGDVSKAWHELLGRVYYKILPIALDFTQMEH